MAEFDAGSSPLDQARTAIQSNQTALAVELLGGVIRTDPSNAEAHELLGVAQCQLGQVAEGIRSLSTAVNFNPAAANARVNLAVALHKSNRTQEAVLQLTEALRLDPAHTRARQALASIQNAAPTNVPPPPPNYLSGSQPLRTDLAGNPIEQTQPVYGQPPPAYGQPGVYGSPPVNPYGAPPQPGGQAPRGYAPMPPPQDAWSPVNIFRVLKSPADFFVPHIGQEELGQPMIFLVICSMITTVCQIVQSVNLTTGTSNDALSIAVSFIVGVFATFVSTAVMHMFVRMFGGGAGFGATFRAVVYGHSPMVLSGVVTAILSFAGTAGIMFAGLVGLVFLIWSIVVLVNGLNVLQDLSTGQSCGSIILSGIVVVILAALTMGAIFSANPTFRNQFMKQFNAGMAQQRTRSGAPTGNNPLFQPGN